MREEIVWLVAAAALVTVIPRVLPLLVMSRLRLPEWALQWLGYVPVAVLAALLASGLLTRDRSLVPLAQNLELFAIVPPLLVAALTRSLILTVVAGVAAIVALRAWLGG